MRYRSVAEETLQYPLELELDGTPGRLPLPPDKAGAVVVEYGEESPAHRPRNLAQRHPSSKLRKCLS
jgi:hypothetical protein